MHQLVNVRQSYDNIQALKHDIINQLNAKAKRRRHTFRWPSINSTSPSRVKSKLGFEIAKLLWNDGKGSITLAQPPRPAINTE
jgi:hypothetical protein